MTKNSKQAYTYDYEIQLSKKQLDAAKRVIEAANSIPVSAALSTSHIYELAKRLPRITTPGLDNIMLSPTPALRVAINALGSITSTGMLSHMQAALKGQAEIINNLTKYLTRGWSSQISKIVKNTQKFVTRSFPPNWTEGQTLSIAPTNLETILLDEGLALAWVPSHSVTEKLFTADSATQRRKILSNNRMGIINTCLTELRTVGEPELKEYVDFAIESAESIQAGYWRSSQALSTNLIDSMILRLFDNQSKITLTSQKQRIDWKSYPIREAVVFGGIWGSYSNYQPGDTNIPRKYTRHASAHAVSNRQYTKINALIALTHLTALIKLISEDFIKD